LDNQSAAKHAKTILKKTDKRITTLAKIFQERLDKAKQRVDERSAFQTEAFIRGGG
jgi:hypothetical protein